MDIRKAFLEFFASKGHEITPSSPLVPNDATLLFTNAGMVPFKDIFTGLAPRPNPPRRTSAQTCIRAGGKHNDLDNVGYTARHHTFFEMLGNFSFGDYFKEDAIAYAWEFVTTVLELPKDRLYVTVHESDDEAFDIWSKHIAPERIYRFGDKDNFWQMGDTGPCGPCSEIFYDQGEEHFNGPEDYMGGDGDRFLEIWNLVFMQYERFEDGRMERLPKPSIDTGMGLERVTAIKEGKFSNFDSSLFMPLINAIARLAGKEYKYSSGASFRVIADHLRSATFLLAQGTTFDKEGRGYVLRRIVRRALRHGYMLGLTEPFMYKLVDELIAQMTEAYSYLSEQADFIKEQLKSEEERFLATLERGINIYEAELENTNGDEFSAEVAFKLYDTYGFPLDLTTDMLRAVNKFVDEAKFDMLMNEQKQRARAAWKGSGDAHDTGDFKELLEEFGENKFLGYDNNEGNCKALAVLDENFKRCKKGIWAMLEPMYFYPTGGGQEAIGGVLEIDGEMFEVIDVRNFAGVKLAKLTKPISEGQSGLARIDSTKRALSARAHSATHLLHLALRQLLGQTATQAGSLVAPGRLRFDFNYTRALSDDELLKLEQMVNEQIMQANTVSASICSLDEAKNQGAMMLFSDKYGEQVRVLKMGDSIELCGGIHASNTAEIGAFVITKESSVSAGVRRIEALVSANALEYLNAQRAELASLKAELKTDDIARSFANLKEQIKQLKSAQISATDFEASLINGVAVAVASVSDAKVAADKLKATHERCVGLFESAGKLACVCKGVQLKAGDLIKQVAQQCGGNGGGRADFATAGCKDLAAVPKALEQARSQIEQALS